MMRHRLHSHTSCSWPPGIVAHRAKLILRPQLGQVFGMTPTVQGGLVLRKCDNAQDAIRLLTQDN